MHLVDIAIICQNDTLCKPICNQPTSYFSDAAFDASKIRSTYRIPLRSVKCEAKKGYGKVFLFVWVNYPVTPYILFCCTCSSEN